MYFTASADYLRGSTSKIQTNERKYGIWEDLFFKQVAS